jgi:hypothetical protein
MSSKGVDPGSQEYLDAIRTRVCAVCLDARDDRSCGLSGRVCEIETHLPAIVAALSSVESTRMEDYENAIRARVCSACEKQDAAGRCALRDDRTCALDVYLSFVLDSVEEVNLRRAARAPLTKT